MKYHLTPVRMVIIKKSTYNLINAVEGMEKGTLLHYWWECKQPLRRFLKKLGIKLPHNPAIPLLCIYPEKTKIEKDTVPQCSRQCYLQ